MSLPARWLGMACLLVAPVAVTAVFSDPAGASAAAKPAPGAVTAANPGGSPPPARLGAPEGKGSQASPARQELTRKAAAGDAASQFTLGVALLQGDFGSTDPGDGLSWMQAAANQGFPPAMARLGRLYRDGVGIKADPFQAVEWFRVAAEAGFQPARIDLALMIAEGKGSHQDLVAAWVLLESASTSLALAPPGEYGEARKVLAELGKRLSPEQMALARQRLEEARQQSLQDMMRRHPGVPGKGKGKAKGTAAPEKGKTPIPETP